MFLSFVEFIGQNIRKLIKDGLIIKKPVAVHSRARVRKNTIARRKGRHSGYGKAVNADDNLAFSSDVICKGVTIAQNDCVILGAVMGI